MTLAESEEAVEIALARLEDELLALLGDSELEAAAELAFGVAARFVIEAAKL